MKNVLDYFKQEIKVGYFVVAHTSSGLHIGQVTNISEKGLVTVDRTGRKYGKIVIPFWYSHRNLMVISNPQECLCAEFLSLFNDQFLETESNKTRTCGYREIEYSEEKIECQLCHKMSHYVDEDMALNTCLECIKQNYKI